MNLSGMTAGIYITVKDNPVKIDVQDNYINLDIKIYLKYFICY